MPIEFIAQKNIRVNLKFSDITKNILKIMGGKDGSVYINCPEKSLAAKKYHSGIIVIPAGSSIVEKIELTELPGVVKSSTAPKLTLHPTGNIQSSFYSAADKELTRRINLGKPLASRIKTIAKFTWENIEEYNDATEVQKKGYHNFSLKIPDNQYQIWGLLKVSYSINKLLKGFHLQEPNQEKKKGKIIICEEIKSDLQEGTFAVMRMPIYNFQKMILVTPEGKKEIKNPMVSLVFGIKHKRRIIWYMLSFFNPADLPVKQVQNRGSYLFSAGFKNHDETRETGEELIIHGTI